MKSKLIESVRERALLVGVRKPQEPKNKVIDSLNELESLVDTAGGVVVDRIWQEIARPQASTYIGKGKVEEIKEKVAAQGIELVVLDEELTPAQNRTLEDSWGVRVLDRTAVILDIFAKRARTKIAKLQVELAQLEYIRPRLVGMWDHFSKQVGGIGVRGPGETQLEVDRRRISDRITFLKRQLEGSRAQRDVQYTKRDIVPIPIVSIVGYTNSGKSTLMNNLTKAGVLVEDKLFATLDTTVRKLRLPSSREVLLADTVGFIKKLPHQLVESFKTTFAEIQRSHLLLHVVDVSDINHDEHARVVLDVLDEIGLKDKPMLTLWNKIDVVGAKHRLSGKEFYISALNGDGIEAVIHEIENVLRHNFKRVKMLLPYQAGEVMSYLYRTNHIWKAEHKEDGIHVDAELHQKFVEKFKKYIISTH